MNLFDKIPSDLFSILASPNRRMYADALNVLYETYRDELRMPEEKLYTMLRSRLEKELAEATFEGEDISEGELKDISGRARFLIRKLKSKGWFEEERGENFQTYITVPGYSSRILGLLRDLQQEGPARGFRYVFGTYSALKIANEEEDESQVYNRMSAVYSAYENTKALIDMLQMVYHELKRYFQQMIDLKNMNQVLAAHYDDFRSKIIDIFISPLKIQDSVPKYRGYICRVLREWSEDEDLVQAMAQKAAADQRGETAENCRSDLLIKINWIIDRYNSIEEEYLREIDKKVRRYTHTTTQKIESMANRDRTVRGNLHCLLETMAQGRVQAQNISDALQPGIQLFEQSCLCEQSLWCRKPSAKREYTAPVLIEPPEPEDPASREEIQDLLFPEYGMMKVREYMDSLLGDADSRLSEEFPVDGDKAYIMSLLIVLYAGELDVPYCIELMGGTAEIQEYTIPRYRLSRKGAEESCSSNG